MVDIKDTLKRLTQKNGEIIFNDKIILNGILYNKVVFKNEKIILVRYYPEQKMYGVLSFEENSSGDNIVNNDLIQASQDVLFKNHSIASAS